MAFFEDLGKKVSKAAQVAAKKSSDLVEITKLNANISSEEDNIKACYRKMGEICFNKFEQGETLDEEQMAYCKEIITHQEKINELKQKVAEIKNEGSSSNEAEGTNVPSSNSEENKESEKEVSLEKNPTEE